MQVAEEGGGGGVEPRNDSSPQFRPRARTSRPSGSVQTDRLMAAVWADNLEADVASPSRTQDPVAATPPSRRRASPRSFSDAAGFVASEKGSFTRSHLADILEADANDDGDFTGVLTGRKLMSTDGLSDASAPMASEKDLNSGSSDTSSPKVKLMCSFEGQILPRPIDGKLRYVGGETRVISVSRNIRIAELLRRLTELYDRAVVLKYQLPEEDLDALVSVSTDEDLENMMEESDKLLSSSVGGGSSLPSKIRVFLFPPSGGSDASSMVGMEDRRDSEQRYIDAINEAVDTSVRKQFDVSSRGSSQNLVGFEIAEAAHSLSSSPSGIMQASVTSWVPIDPVLPPLNNISNNNDNNNNDRNTSNSNNRRDPSIGRRFGSNMSSSFPSHQPDKRLDTRFTQSPLPPTDSLGVDMPEKQLDSLWKPDFEGHYGNSQTSHLASLPTSETIPLPPYQKGGGDVQDVESGFGGELISNYNEIPQPSEAPILSKLETLESFPSSMRGSFRLISSSSEEPLSNLLPFIDSKDPTFLRSEHNADELEFLSGMWMTMSSPKENQEFTDSQWKTQIEIHDESRSNIFLTPLCDPPMGQTASFSPSQDDQETGNGNSLQRSKEPHLDENLSILSQSIDSGAPSFRCGEHDDVDEVGFLTGAWVVPLISQKIESKESERGSTDSCERSSYDFFGVSPSSAKKQEEAHESHSNNEAVPTSSFEDSQDITLGNSMGQTEERRSEEHSSSLTPLLDGVDPADPSFRRSEHIDVDEAGFLTGAWMTSSLNQKTVSASASSSSSSSSSEESEGSVDCNEQLYSFLSKDSHLRTQVEMGNTSSSPPAVRETHSSQSDSFPSHFPSGPISSSSSSATSSVVQDNHETRNGNPLQQTQEPLLTPPPLLIRNELDVAGESGFSTGTWMTLLSQMVSKQSKGSNDSYEQSYAVLSADYQRRAQLDSKHPLSNSPKIHSDNVELIPSLSPSYIKSSSFLNQASKSPQGLQDGSSTQMNTGEETTPVTSSKPSDSVPSSSEGGKWDNILSVDDLLGLTAKKELNRIDSGTSKSEGDNHPSFKQENSAFVGYSSVDFLFLHRKHTEETPLAIKQSDKDSPLPSIIRHPLLANPESGATAMPGVEGIEEVIVLESSDSAKPVFPVFESQQEEQKERDRMFDQNWEKVLQEAEAEEQLLTANANEEISKADLELEKEGGNYEEAKIEDTSIPRNVAAEAEAEAISRGLQIIRNADLEERRELGSGTFGTVYHGKWRGTDVAIKRIKSSCFMGRPAERESLMADFWREAIILGQLHHPNVVAFYGVVPDGPGGTLATVTEFMVNGSLKHVLQTKDRSIDHRKRLLIAMDAAFGMEYLHGKRIVHFDLKCENLLVNMRDPHRPICKVGDLGLSKVKQQTMVSGGVRGTLPWMAPELLNGSSNLVSERVDVFSFGIAMWEILTGMEPYQNMHYGAIIGGIASNTLRPSIPRSCNPAWKSLMVRCWSADPMERPPFSEIARELRSMAALVQPKTQQAKA